MAVFEVKWQADASLLSKVFLLKKIEEQLNLIALDDFQEEKVIKKIVVFVQAFKSLTLSQREAKANYNPKKKVLEITVHVNFEDLSACESELDTYGLLVETVLLGIVDLVYVDGFDSYALAETAEYMLFPEE